jgi:hypothetical protein
VGLERGQFRVFVYLERLARLQHSHGRDYFLEDIFDLCFVCVAGAGGEILDECKQDIFMRREVRHSVSAAVVVGTFSIVDLAFHASGRSSSAFRLWSSWLVVGQLPNYTGKGCAGSLRLRQFVHCVLSSCQSQHLITLLTALAVLFPLAPSYGGGGRCCLGISTRPPCCSKLGTEDWILILRIVVCTSRASRELWRRREDTSLEGVCTRTSISQSMMVISIGRGHFAAALAGFPNALV